MTKRYAVLEKKLEELEAQLTEVFALPIEIEIENDAPRRQLLSEIDQRFVFLKNLLSAEIKSNPEKPHHLYHIAQRLTELETAFRIWDNFNAFSIDHLDTASSCSCTESCLNDDGCASPESEYHIYEDPKTSFGGMVEDGGRDFLSKENLPLEKKVDEMLAMETVKFETEEEKRRVWIGKNGGVFVTGIVMFAVVLIGVVIERFSRGGYYRGGMEVFLVPT